MANDAILSTLQRVLLEEKLQVLKNKLSHTHPSEASVGSVGKRSGAPCLRFIMRVSGIRDIFAQKTAHLDQVRMWTQYSSGELYLDCDDELRRLDASTFSSLYRQIVWDHLVRKFCKETISRAHPSRWTNTMSSAWTADHGDS